VSHRHERLSFVKFKAGLAALVGALNGRGGDVVDRLPVRYRSKAFSQLTPGFSRAAHFGPVKPAAATRNFLPRSFIVRRAFVALFSVE
jgi:hypothetical protein